MTFNRMTFNRMTFNRMTFNRMTFSRITLCTPTFIKIIKSYSFSDNYQFVFSSTDCHSVRCYCAERRGANKTNSLTHEV